MLNICTAKRHLGSLLSLLPKSLIGLGSQGTAQPARLQTSPLASKSNGNPLTLSLDHQTFTALHVLQAESSEEINAQNFKNDEGVRARSCTSAGGIACGSSNGRPNCCNPVVGNNTCALYGGGTAGLGCSACSTNCRGNITTALITACQSKNTCSFTASNGNTDGGDPCPGTYKYTNVSYLCV